MHAKTGSGLLSFLRPLIGRSAAACGLAVLLCFCVGLRGQETLAGQARRVAREARTRRFLGGRRVVRGAEPAAMLGRARAEHLKMLAEPRATALSAAWTAVGPGQVASQTFGSVTGRVTALAIDPADATGNTLYVGTTGGGVWKSTNAAGAAANVAFQPLTDTLPVFSANAGTSVLPSLSIGALAVGGGVVLAGTGDPNDATDSYYGGGILRSADGGSTWTLVTGARDGAAGNHTFDGLAVAGIAFSTAAPTVAVAALTTAAEGVLVNAPFGSSRERGLFYTQDAGLTWHAATLMDGNQSVGSAGGADGSVGNSATAVVWNPVRARFYAAVVAHGYYESADGMVWTRLRAQPGAGLTTGNCPAGAASGACPIARGALAVQAATGDLFALTVDGANQDEGLYQDVCASTGTACASATVLFAKKVASAGLEVGSGSTVIAQADYNLALSAAPLGPDTVLYVGTIDLYRCSVATGCVLRDTTNAENGCLNPAGVAPAQHALAAGAGGLLYVGNDGGVYRSTDGVAQTGAVCSAGDAGHFDNLNGGLGSLAEVVSFAEDPVDAGTLLAGLGAMGTAGTGSAGGVWAQLATGEGGTVAIDAQAPADWYVSTGAGVNVTRCAKGAGCGAADFASATPTIGETQVGNDVAAVHAPFLLDPGADANLLVGTCRVWRGPAANGALWSSANELSRPFGNSAATACPGSGTSAVVRSLGAGGPAGASSNAQSTGAEVLYAGMAGTLDGGGGVGGHVFTTAAANLANGAAVWTDAAKGTVTNDTDNAGVFNPGGFDVSSVTVDAHDATGRTVYATVMGFIGNGVDEPRVYRSVDGGGHWLDVSSNLPVAPANALAVDPNDANTVYVALDTGVYVTTQVSTCAAGACWSVYGSALPNAPAVGLAAAALMPTGDGRVGELRVATYGRGIWQVPLLTAISPAAPAIALNPTSLVFGSQAIGTLSAAMTVTVTNTGNASLTVSRVAAAGDFITSDTCVGTPVAQGATCTVGVQFQPTAVGARTGLLTVYGNVAGGQATAALSGTGTAAATIVLTPGALDFGKVDVGATSATGYVTIANTGGTTAALGTPVVTGDYHLAANTCGATLAASTSCTVGIDLMPTASGVRAGTLTETDDAGTQVASLTGTGTTPATDALAPASLNFAAQQIGTTSAVQAVTLTNAGDVALGLVAGRITSGDFTVVNNCGTSLAAHSACTFTVAYVPKSVGAEAGVLMVSDQFRSQTVMLNGVGLAPPGVSLSPANGLVFGATGVGLSAAAQVVTLTNNGGVPLLIAGVAVTGDFALLASANTCGSTLAPAAVCSVGVVFVPTAAGARTGAVVFSDNAGNSPESVGLSGTGVDFALAADGPTTMTVASGGAGSSGTATYTLLLSAAVGTPGSAAFTCSGAPVHATCTVNPANAALGGTQVVTVSVATGIATARLESSPWERRTVWLAMLVPMGLLVRRRRRVVGVLACLLVLGGCSTGRTIPGSTSNTPVVPIVTPSGSYTLVVAGSSAGLVRAVNVTLVVQ